MYYCETCHVMHKSKPYIVSSCDYCGSKTIKTLSKKTNIIIEDIDMDSSYKAILNEFYSINNFEPRNDQTPSWRYRSRAQLFRTADAEHQDLRPYGFIRDNLTSFMELSRTDLDQMWLKIFGKSSLKYYSTVFARVRCSLYDHYILVPMNITTMIDWFKDNDKSYRIVYNKSIWCIEQLSAPDVTAPLVEQLLNNGRVQNTSDRSYYSSNLIFIG